mgnify:CR=1 FL=1
MIERGRPGNSENIGHACSMHTCMHMHAYIHTYIHGNIRTCKRAHKQAHTRACIHSVWIAAVPLFVSTSVAEFVAR